LKRPWIIVCSCLLLLGILALSISCGSTTTTVSQTATATATQTTTATQTATATTTQTTTTTATKTTTTTPPKTPKAGGNLRIIYPYFGDQIGWPAGQGRATISWQLCFDTLLTQQMDGTLGYALATGYKIGDDLKSVTFTLRQGVKFHDGSPFNAEAVKWNIDQLKAAKVGDTRYMDSVDVLGDYTVRINVNTWLNWLVTDFTSMWMVSPTAYQKNGVDWIKNNMVGTGPFIQVSYQLDTELKLKKNPDYWIKGKPLVDTVDIMCVTDSMTAQATILSGGADILNTEADQKVISLKQSGLQAITRPVGVMAIWPDSANPASPLANLKVREAMEYAIDKETIAKTIEGGFFIPAYQMAPPNVSAYSTAITGRKYDPAKAKQLLTEAGYPNGFEFTLVPVPVQMFNDCAVAVQADMAKVGIKANLQMITIATFGSYVMGDWKNTGVLAAVSSAIPNWAQALSGFFAPNNGVFTPTLRSDAFIKAYNAAATTKEYDIAKTQALLKQIYDDQMVIPTFASGEAWVYQSYVKGAWDVWPAGLQMYSLADCWLDK
jgi:peptide/nickel transport system substrate-binding protein